MVLPADLSAPSPTIGIVPLSTASAQKMVDLTTLAFPGFFRSRTCEMGSYYGVRSPSGELISMGGERLQLDGYSEISAVCTHPSFRGQGFAAGLIWHLVRNHRCDVLVAWLHVGAPIAPSNSISEWGSSRSAKSRYIAYPARLSELALWFFVFPVALAFMPALQS
jgi:hypothetical protein